MSSNKKFMLISVGGSSKPVVVSLNHQKPDYICFFVSEETKKIPQTEILPNLTFTPKHWDFLVTPAAEGLSESYRTISEELPRILKKWNINPSDIIVDYTGGTKNMSAALVLATIEYTSKYSYVGGVERTKEGIGVVVDDKEKMLFHDNPWMELALTERKKASILFNKGRYASAAEVLKDIANKIPEKEGIFFKSFSGIVEGYDLWDRFKHKDAHIKIRKNLDTFKAYCYGSREERLNKLVDHIKRNVEFLEKLITEKEDYYFYDLIANAKRRADLEGKYDDAVARLYRAIEFLAQNRLKSKYSIKTSNINKIDIPNSLRDEYIKKYTDPEGKINLPLYASYKLLEELHDELGKRFMVQYERELKHLLSLRNNSILAHGFDSISKNAYEKFYLNILEFANINEDIIPTFPYIEL
jgi:CRISPR-associated protein (TIGR02710 family)